ncbi:AUGMIN subunit 8-like isoform X1 [Abrus precatorius]|uniref:AUGMIN subunit 8-like isoform X1 n=1 Tax=Abrus precatorius TaxID=3816 RepID=A0A8B8M2A7_ABRPR|nr:AUGMIN subunit 8-like isoform X1 [Abrus precatorius]XP_027362677.1 AUGMIN subunit 8-like isoform X1 [Abrus precatorius]
MDVCKSEQASRKHKAAETPRPLLVLAEKNNAVTTTGRSGTREVSSRYKSPTPASPSGSRRCPSPNLTRTTTPASSSQLLPKRSLSAERKRPSTPPSPPTPRPSTPVNNSSVDGKLSKRVSGSRLPDSLWPSTMRSLSVSFQSDTISIPVSKKEKPVASASDRTLRPASNVAHKQAETPTVRKPTPERKCSPLNGKNASAQSENSKPADSSLPSRLIDQHRWPGRIGGKVSSSALNRSVDCGDTRTLNTSVSGTVFSSQRRLSRSDESSKPLQRASSDAVRLLPLIGSGRIGSEAKSVDDCSLHKLRPHKFVATSPTNKAGFASAGVRSQSSSAPGSRLPSPSRTSLSSSSSRGVSPSRSRPSTPPSRGISPSRIRSTNSSIQSNNSTSVLSFIADFKKGKKGAAYIEDAHQLRLLYNRYLQWRFASAKADAVLYIQNAIVEKTLYNVWITTSSMWESIVRKRINLQQLKLELKLNSVLNDQMIYLDDWAVLERDHIDAVSGAVEDLEASTLRLPVTGGATADIEHLKVAICQAVDVMQAMGSAICSLLLQIESMNNLISEVAVKAAQEKTMLDECEMLLASVAAMQVEESSLRTHLVQIKQVTNSGNLNNHEPDLLPSQQVINYLLRLQP